MAQLKAGHVADFSDSMAQAIEIAMQQELQAVKGVALPKEFQDERRLLFVAIARGILQYLKAHQNEILNSITLETGGIQTTSPVTKLDLNIPGT